MEFQGQIRVASRIIDSLSSGLYPSPAACLKELINNSYDADATVVNVFVKPDADRIIIEDNGIGISRDEFERHFERISESHKRDISSITDSGRPKIGKIGIGFIAANEVCEIMEIFSTKAGSGELLHVVVNFDEMRKPIEERRVDGDLVKADYEGEVLEAPINEHYTHVFLVNIRGEARDILVGARTGETAGSAPSLYGFGEKTIAAALQESRLNTWKDFDLYSETLLHISLNVPVEYHSVWLPADLEPSVKEFVDATKRLNFKVHYDKTPLRKPIVFDIDANALIQRFDYDGRNVGAKGYFYAQHGSIKPREIQGLLVRIRNAAVGEFDPQFWGFSPSEFSLIQRWVSAEIWADDRLEEAMNIDRRTLRVTHPAYVELRDAIHNQLRSVLARARTEIYERGNKQRKKARVNEARRTFSKDILASVSTVSETAASQLESTFVEHITNNDRAEKILLRKYSLSELYKLVVDVASEVLDKRDFAKFLNVLTRRLGDK